MAWTRLNAPPYRDYRFWLIQVLNLIACIQVTSLPSKGADLEVLTRSLQSSWVLKSFVLFFLIAAFASGLIFGVKGAVSTIFLTSFFLVPKLIQWSSLPYDRVIAARVGVISGLSIVVAYLVSRERKTRFNLQILNEKMKEIIREKEKYFKLASEAQENERRRISRDLHDDSLQLLAAAMHQLDGAIEAKDPIKANAQVQRAKETISQTIEAIRRYCEELRPLLLDSLGLVAAVEWLGHQLEQARGITVTFEKLGDERPIRAQDKIHVFRIVQEAFNNIERHSKATEVSVVWDYTGGDFNISVTDNGIGMWNFGPTPTRSLGIQGMYERTELIEGSLSIESQPGFGTKVSLQIPFE